MKRRQFLKSSLTVSAVAGLSTASLTASAAGLSGKKQEHYELRAYRLKSGANHTLLDQYLEKAAIPAWNRLGGKPVGVFVQQEREGTAAGTEVRDSSVVYVLIPYPSLDAFVKATGQLNEDSLAGNGAPEYLAAMKDNPAFDRIDSWLMLAFAGLPQIELPPYSREKKQRMFEIRTYESHSEVKALKKVQMFNSGEIDVMREVGLAPVFYGQALIGRDLPHLTYMLSAEDADAHKQHWSAFGKHPVWAKLQKEPQYADTVSKIRNQFLVPTSYSQI
jgi:hypothetical protein